MQLDSTGYICLDNKTHSFTLVGSNNDTCYIDVVTSSSEFNMKPRIFIEIYTKSINALGISLKGNSGTINMWEGYVHQSTGYYGFFSANSRTWAVDGDVSMTIGDFASGKSAIAVGAYASKTSFTNASGNNTSYTSFATKGNIAPFSSLGPTVDGRVKPDITAPGLVVGAAVSSLDPSYITGGGSYSSVQTVFTNPTDGKSYSYGMLMGTSMSSPVVSGIVALMLQAKPSLTPQQVVDALSETAIEDNFTGNLPTGGNSTWGHGKVNAYAAVLKAEQLPTRIVNYSGKGSLDCRIYPNPSSGAINIEYSSNTSEMLSIKLYDLPGHLVKDEMVAAKRGSNNIPFDLNDIGKGVYLVKMTSQSGTAVMKVVVE